MDVKTRYEELNKIKKEFVEAGLFVPELEECLGAMAELEPLINEE